MPNITDETLKHAVNMLQKANIAVLGDLILDQYIFGQVNRISPEAPVPIVTVEKKMLALGGAANVAANIKSAGGQVTLLGCIGADPNAAAFKKLLRAIKINSDYLVTDQQKATISKTRIIAQNQQIVRVDEEDSNALSTNTERVLIQNIKTQLQKNKISSIIFSDYNKGTLTPKCIQTTIELAQKLNIKTVADTKYSKLLHYRGIDIIKPNLKELSEMAQIPIVNETDIKKAGRIVMEKLGCTTILATRGAAGITIITKDKPQVTIPGFAKKVYDVTGAGDTVISIFTMAINQGFSTKIATILANIAGNIVVGQVGTSAIERMQLLDFIHNNKVNLAT